MKKFKDSLDAIINMYVTKDISVNLNYFKLFRMGYLHIYSYNIKIEQGIDGIEKITKFKGTRFMRYKTYLFCKELLESEDKDNQTIVIEIFKNSI